ncbi:MAG: glycosyl transferase family 2, partial [Bacteroidota bacterium]|nr:glycosyl transferase family 2 [Bacteroidota bacterium]
MADKQVFQTDTPGRWIRFKWLSRVLLVVLVCSIAAAVIIINSKQYPLLPNLNPAPKKLTKEELDQLKRSKKFKDFKIDKDDIQKLARARHLHQLKRPNNKDRINAGFYRAWEPQAY